MRLRTLAATALLGAVGAAAAPAELHIEGLPLVFEHRWGARPDGTQFDRWRAVAGLWNTERLTYPGGAVGRRWWLTPLFEYTVNVDGFTEWSLLWPAPLLKHRWGVERGRERSWWTGLFWLFQAQSEGEGADWRLSNFLLIPLFNFSSWEDGHLWIAPLIPLAGQERGQKRMDYFFPWLHYSEGPDAAGTAVIPFFWSDRDAREGRQKSVFYLFPFLRQTSLNTQNQSSSETWFLLPAFHYEEHSAHPRWGGDEAPLHVSNWGILPMTWGYKNSSLHHVRLYPLVFWRPERFVIFPFFWRAERDDGVSELMFVPFWGWREYRGQWAETELTRPGDLRRRSEFLLFPLWLSSHESSGEMSYTQRNVLWPLIAWGEGNVMWQTENSHRTHRRVLPFWWRTDTAFDTISTRRGHFERIRYRNVSGGTFAPFHWYDRRRENGELVASDNVLFPFYWDLLERPSDFRPHLQSEHHRRGLIPLWFGERIDGHLRRLSVLWPLLQMRWPEQAAGETEAPEFSLRVAWLLGGYERWASGRRLVEVLGGPLYQREVEGDSVHASVLWRLFEYNREGTRRDMRLLFLPWHIPLP
jgi:hypothetical protein